MENAGNVWTWTAIDADSKLIVRWNIGNKYANSANTFMHDVASRIANRVQLTTDVYTRTWIRKTLRVTLAMAAGITKRFMTIEDFTRLAPSMLLKSGVHIRNVKFQTETQPVVILL